MPHLRMVILMLPMRLIFLDLMIRLIGWCEQKGLVCIHSVQ